MKAVYFFCIDPSQDRVAPAAFEACRAIHSLVPAGLSWDDQPVLRHDHPAGHSFFFVPTREVVSDNFPRYLPMLNGMFGDCDLAAIVNWHEGANAPDAIFCAHTSGDVPSGVFGPADPRLTTAAVLALEQSRIEAGLGEWRTLTEATHFSGIQCGAKPEVIPAYPVPVIDIEIGSSPATWSARDAIIALARALPRVFDAVPENVPSILFLGGVHFEPCLRDAVVSCPDRPRVTFSHVLPNHWLNSGNYQDGTGLARLRAAVASIRGGIQAIVMHESLKGAIKNVAKAMAAELDVPAVKHRRLREGPFVLGN